MTRGQLDTLGRQQVDVGIMVFGRWQVLMHRINNLLILLRPGDGQYLRMQFTNLCFIHTHAASDNHLAVFVQGFSNRLQRFSLGGINKTAGIHNHQIGILITGDQIITLPAQLGENAF